VVLGGLGVEFWRGLFGGLEGTLCRLVLCTVMEMMGLAMRTLMRPLRGKEWEVRFILKN
jgi:hypothetical protein